MSGKSNSLATTPLSLNPGAKMNHTLRVEENEAFTLYVATCVIERPLGKPDILPEQASVVRKDEDGLL